MKLPTKTNKQFVPEQIVEAQEKLKAALPAVRKAKTYDELRRIERWADAMRVFWRHIEDLRRQAEIVIIVAAWRSGQMAIKEGNSRGGDRRSKSSVKTLKPPTVTEMFGSRIRGIRLRKLGKVETEDELQEAISHMHGDDREATVSAILKLMAAWRGEARRNRSRSAKPLPDGMELRIGDCRVVLADVPDNSVSLILTDPPYEAESEPLYKWLGEFAARVLIPGGSLICYTGHWSLDRDMRIFGEYLRYWWLLIMMHQQSQRLPGKFIIANFKPVLWYVKEFRRGRSLMPDLLNSQARDKEFHNWAQGDGGVSQVIEHLTEPNEKIIDPFAGTGKWGRIAANMGRRWLGSDVVDGGATVVVAAKSQEEDKCAATSEPIVSAAAAE